MIHYTLLPEKEIKKLRREYRIRLTIFLLFFMSCSVFVGIISLMPAYIYSYTQEKEALDKLEELQAKRKSDTIGPIKKELSDNTIVINKIKNINDSVIYSNIVSKIISQKPSGVSIKSFDMQAAGGSATSTVTVAIQGKALTRESLVAFKDRLTKDPLITKVELPVSDLAKSRDISYSIKVSITPIP
jgi:hypothetical protein